jgi:hypothetical protein
MTMLLADRLSRISAPARAAAVDGGLGRPDVLADLGMEGEGRRAAGPEQQVGAERNQTVGDLQRPAGDPRRPLANQRRS